MKLLSKFFVSRKSLDRLADELHRTSLALERSRAESADLKRRLKNVEQDLAHSQTEVLDLDHTRVHLLGLLAKAHNELEAHKRKRLNQSRERIETKPLTKRGQRPLGGVGRNQPHNQRASNHNTPKQ